MPLHTLLSSRILSALLVCLCENLVRAADRASEEKVVETPSPLGPQVRRQTTSAAMLGSVTHTVHTVMPLHTCLSASVRTSGVLCARTWCEQLTGQAKRRLTEAPSLARPQVHPHRQPQQPCLAQSRVGRAHARSARAGQERTRICVDNGHLVLRSQTPAERRQAQPVKASADEVCENAAEPADGGEPAGTETVLSIVEGAALAYRARGSPYSFSLGQAWMLCEISSKEASCRTTTLAKRHAGS